MRHLAHLFSEDNDRTVTNADEWVLDDVDMVHYEVMEEGRAVWMGLYLKDGSLFHLNITGNRLTTRFTDETA
jgi:hypothetical protein